MSGSFPSAFRVTLSVPAGGRSQEGVGGTVSFALCQRRARRRPPSAARRTAGGEVPARGATSGSAALPAPLPAPVLQEVEMTAVVAEETLPPPPPPPPAAGGAIRRRKQRDKSPPASELSQEEFEAKYPTKEARSLKYGRDRNRRRPQAKQDAHNAARHRRGGAGA